MAKTITITNGSGTGNVGNGNYSVTSTVPGYDNTSINPSSVTVEAGTNTYAFTVAATGTLTLHVTEDGTSSGTPVVGATFIRTDASGNEYGSAVTTDSNGDAILANVPYGESAPAVYYKETASDADHDFDSSIQNATLTNATLTVEITNALLPERTFNLTDANYTGLPLNGDLTINNS